MISPRRRRKRRYGSCIRFQQYTLNGCPSLPPAWSHPVRIQRNTKEDSVLTSIIYALDYMCTERLEPEFIRRYRQDVVSSAAVRENLYSVIYEDGEWERMTDARSKIEGILTAESSNDEEGEELMMLRSQLQATEKDLVRKNGYLWDEVW